MTVMSKSICQIGKYVKKYIDLENSCLTKWEKRQVRNLIYENKDAFSLRDKIGTCPNIEVEIDIMEENPFFIRPFHAREEDKALLDKEMKRLCYLGILKEGLSAYSSPFMLVSRKMTKDKRVMTDFTPQHENSQKQSGLSFVEGHIYPIGKF